MAKVLIIYYSKTGNTEKLANLVAEGCQQVPGVEVEMVRLPAPALEDVLRALAAADGCAIGSPEYYSYMAGHVKTFFDEALAYRAQLAGKPYVAFGTHGGGARVLDSLERLCQAQGLRQAAPGLMCAGAPGPAEVQAAHNLGRALAQAATGH
jgi:flavorubredoxin